MNVGTKSNPIEVTAKEAVTLYALASGGNFNVPRNVSINFLLKARLIKEARSTMQVAKDHVVVEITHAGRLAAKRMRNQIWSM